MLSLSFGGLGVGIVVGLDQNEVVGLWVDYKFPGGVLQRKGHLVEDSSQFLQSQDSARKIMIREDEEEGQTVTNHFELGALNMDLCFSIEQKLLAYAIWVLTLKAQKYGHKSAVLLLTASSNNG